VLAACELALAGATVTFIDADPNQNVIDWALLGDLPETLTVIGCSSASSRRHSRTSRRTPSTCSGC
jgi:cellulose biosynthesis protein BcsQ